MRTFVALTLLVSSLASAADSTVWKGQGVLIDQRGVSYDCEISVSFARSGGDLAIQDEYRCGPGAIWMESWDQGYRISGNQVLLEGRPVGSVIAGRYEILRQGFADAHGNPAQSPLHAPLPARRQPRAV